MAKFTQKGLQSQKKAYSDEATGSVATPLKGLEIQAPGLTPQAAPVDSFVRTGRPNAPGAVQLGELARLPEPAEITNLENLSRSLGSLNTNLQNAVNSYLGYEKDRYEEIQLEAQALVATNKEEDYAAIGRVLREKANDPNLSQEERDGANKLLLRLSSDGRLERSVKSELKVQKVLLNAANLNNTLLNSKVTNDEGEAIDLLSVDSSNPLWSQQASQNIYEDLDLNPKEYKRVQPIVANALSNARKTHDTQHIEYKYNNYRGQTNFNLTQLGQRFASGEATFEEAVDTLQMYVDLPRVQLPISTKAQRKQLNEDLFTVFATGYLKDNEGADPNMLRVLFMNLSTGPMEGRTTGASGFVQLNPKQLWVYQQEDFDIDKKIIELDNQLAEADKEKTETAVIDQKGILNDRFTKEIAPLIAKGEYAKATKAYQKMKVDYINEVADLSPAIYVPALKEFDTNFNRAISVSDPEIEEEMRKIRSTFLTGLYSYDSAKGVQASIENLLIKYPWNKRVQKFHENNYDKFDVSRTETYKGYKKQLDGKIAEVDTLIETYNTTGNMGDEYIGAISEYQPYKDEIIETFTETLDKAQAENLPKAETRKLLEENLRNIEIPRIERSLLVRKNKITPQSDLTFFDAQKELRDLGVNNAVPTTSTTSFAKDKLVNNTNPYYSLGLATRLFDLAVDGRLPKEFVNFAKAADLTVVEMIEQQLRKHPKKFGNLDAALAKIKENYP
tara:strand:- start:2039 stop:4231 length:2193 start_codon:yes stop_codon:yes gene_type:complete